MTRQITIERFAYSERFQAEFSKLEPAVLEAAKAALVFFNPIQTLAVLGFIPFQVFQSQQFGRLTSTEPFLANHF